MPECFPENLWIRLGEETDEPTDLLLVAHVDEVVRASKKLIQIEGQLIAGHIFPHPCEI